MPNTASASSSTSVANEEGWTVVRSQKPRPSSSETSRKSRQGGPSSSSSSSKSSSTRPRPSNHPGKNGSRSQKFLSTRSSRPSGRPRFSHPKDRHPIDPSEPSSPRKRSNSICSIGSTHSDDSVESEAGIEPPPENFDAPVSVMCPLDGCDGDGVFTKPRPLVSHLLNTHHLRIHNLHHMYNSLQAYLETWASLLRQSPLPEGISKADVVLPDPAGKKEGKVDHDDPVPHHPITLITVDPEQCPTDQDLRSRLQREALERILAVQEKERQAGADMETKCLFCKYLSHSRPSLFRHMFSVHNFNIGLPDNLVNVPDYLAVLQAKLDNLQCLYCEKTFTTPAVLRKHMRKKKHFKISSWNRLYDRYYIVNYLEPGKNWQDFEADPANESGDEGGGAVDWEDWDEPDVEPTQCLFDQTISSSPEEAHDHMKEAHGFDLFDLQEKYNLDFYKTVALINYIRTQVSDHVCPAQCQDARAWESPQALLDHMTKDACFTHLPSTDSPVWKDPQFLFPAMEDDPLIMLLDPLEEGEAEEGTNGEDGPTASSDLDSADLRRKKEDMVRMLRQLRVDPTTEDVNKAIIKEVQRMEGEMVKSSSFKDSPSAIASTSKE